MEKEKALEIWDAIYGKGQPWQQDCFGTWMYRDDYGDTETKRVRPGNTKEYKYGWEIDHIRPKSDFETESDADFLNNYEPMQWYNNRDKAANYPFFKINNVKYKVVKCEICKRNGVKGYGIENAEAKRVDWKGAMNKYFINE